MEVKCLRVTETAASLQGIRFGLLSSEDVVKLSVQATEKAVQVTDSCLGLPLPDEAFCSYCNTKNASECPGHFGHIKLANPVYHPQHIHKVCEILRKICLQCGDLRANLRKKLTADEILQFEQAVQKRSAPGVTQPKQELEVDENFIALSDDDNVDLLIEVADMELKPKPTGPCRFCTRGYRHPNVKVALLKAEEGKKGYVQVIRLRYPGKGEDFPEDYWASLRIGVEAAHLSKKLDLLASQTRVILKRIPGPVMRQLKIDGSPDKFIIESFPVPPNCMQASGNYEYDLDSTAVQRTAALRSLVKKNADLKLAKARKSKEVFSESKKLQFLISQYLRLKGCQKVRGNDEPGTWRRPAPADFGAIWKTRLKDTILGKMTQYCALALLTGDPNVSVEEIMVPEEIAMQVTVPERVTNYNYTKLQVLVVDMESGFIERNGMTMDLRVVSSKKIDIGDIVHRPLQEGDLLYANRTPSIHKHSIITFKIRIHSGKTIKVNPLVCAPFQADFDGDRMHVYFPQSADAVAESNELMRLQKQLISSQNGYVLVNLIQDSLLAAYHLVSSKMMFSRAEINQLAVHTSKPIPEPGVFSAKHGPLWTGFQVFSLLLPSQLTFSAESGVFVVDGELLAVGDEFSWLRSSSKGLLYAIYQQLGVTEAVSYLDLCSTVLKQLLLIEGFSIGLEDFSLNTRPEFKNDISSIVNSVKDCKAVRRLEDAQLEVDQVIRKHISKGNALQAMMKAGSKGSISHMRQHVGCVGVQLHRHDEPVSGFHPFIGKSFWEGLSPSEFYQHSICSRDLLTKQLHLSVAGTLGDMLMKHLGDVYYAYDGTVRHRCMQQIIRFDYGETPKVDPGEAVGTLAGFAVKQQAYEAVLSAPHSPLKYLEAFKQTLQSSSKTSVKEQDRTVMLRLRRCETEGCHLLEKRCLSVKHLLQNVKLKEVSRKIVIEWTPINCSWLCHFHLDMESIEGFNLNPQAIADFVGRSVAYLSPTLLHTCSYVARCQQSYAPCFHLETGGREDEEIANLLRVLKETLVPRLLNSSITGKRFTEAVNIIWEDKDDLYGIDEAPIDGEPVVKAVMITQERSQAYGWANRSCGRLSDYIDWNRSTPRSVQQVYETLGIEAAYQCIYRRLVRIMKKLDVNVDPVHLALVAEFCTHTGKVLGYTEPGFNEFINSVGASAPFLQATLKTPIKKFEKAAQNGKIDSLDSIVASTSWGKRPPMGTGSDFKLLWSEKNVEDRTYNLLNKMDAHEYLASLAEDVHCTPSTPTIVEDREIETCMSPFIDRSGSGADNDADNTWNSENTWENDTAAADGWGAPAGGDTGNDNVWGSPTGGDTGNDNAWGVSTTTDNGGQANGDTANDGWGDTDTPGGEKNGWPETDAPADGNDSPAEKNDLNGWGDDQQNGNEMSEAERADAVAANEAAQRERIKHFASREEGETADDDNETPGKVFKPTGSNTIPLGTRKGQKPFKPTGSNTIPLGTRRGFGNNTTENNPAEQSQEDGWGDTNINERSDTGWEEQGPDGWSTPADQTGASDWGDENEIRVQEKRTDDKDDNQTGGDRPQRSETEDPVKKKFFAEVFPLVKSVREILMRYNSGDRLSEEDELVILENVLIHHPQYQSKFGTLIDFVKVDHSISHPENNCFFVVRRDGTPEPFSYHECLRNLVLQTFPADYPAFYDTVFKRNAPAGSFKRPQRSGNGDVPMKEEDPVRKKFFEEVFPLVKSVREILIRYTRGERLSEEDETLLMEKVVIHHPRYDIKAGTGIDFIKVDQSVDHPDSNCFFVVRRDGTADDFSYHKCLRHFVQQTFPAEYPAFYDLLFIPKDRNAPVPILASAETQV